MLKSNKTTGPSCCKRCTWDWRVVPGWSMDVPPLFTLHHVPDLCGPVDWGWYCRWTTLLFQTFWYQDIV